jgi:hypothetical protein
VAGYVEHYNAAWLHSAIGYAAQARWKVARQAARTAVA